MGRAARQREVIPVDLGGIMDERFKPQPLARWYTAAAIASVLFMLVAVGGYVLDVTADPSSIPIDRQALVEARPVWMVAAYAMAVWVGLAGAVLLVLRRKLAEPLLLVSLIAAAINASVCEIWTDIDGMHNNDPRVVTNTKPIANLSFDEAAELAYFGAKILHPQSVFPAQKYNVPVRLLNTMDPQAKGTLISKNGGEKGSIRAIAAKDGITAIHIHSTRMLLAYGFLRKVFEIFERYKTPIDMITTSEVAVSLSIDDTSNLLEIIKEVESFGKVGVDEGQTIVCVVGDFGANTHGYAARVLDAVKHLPVRMISYGGSDYNVSILLDSKHKTEALRSLHNRLF